jgi:hypothetical protein
MSVWTDWDPLEEVIVGNCRTSVPNNWGAAPEEKKLLDQIFQETKEDLDNLSTFIESFGIKVHRPKLYEFSEEIELPKFKVFNDTVNYRFRFRPRGASGELNTYGE